MSESNATILIPDISGFTEFMTTTELTHSTHAINILIDAILNAIGEEYEVSEIEGDAVLLIKKGVAPSKKEIIDSCLRIFNAFHFQRKWMQQHTVCPCGACQGIINLTLKFVAHHGPLAEIKVGRFVKQSGPEMIVAHRLLKNSINNNEYLLMTEKLLQQATDIAEPVEMEWASSYEEYSSIGKVDYRFTLLNEARKKVPEPPEPEYYYRSDNTSYLEIPISSNFMDVYMVIMNIPGRPQWLQGLENVQQDRPEVFIGSVHRCTYTDYKAIISPLRMSTSEEGMMYAERCIIEELNLNLVYEYVFKKINDKVCNFACRFMNSQDSPIPEEHVGRLFENVKVMAECLKGYCENLEGSFFLKEPNRL